MTNSSASPSKAADSPTPSPKDPSATKPSQSALDEAPAADDKKPRVAKKSAAAKRKTTRREPKSRSPFEIAGQKVTAGKRKRIELPIGSLMSGTPVALPLIVVHGKQDGPVMWLSAAIHGDEICGVEIIRQVLEEVSATTMSGTLIAAPVVNVHGFNTNDRYLPDRRDLNRSFPGSKRGSLASRIAALFMSEVVERSDVGIDLHTGSDLRTNLAQIRCDLDHAPTRALAETFGTPIVVHSGLRDGSLRQAAAERGKIMLLFEGGEASRFDPIAIAAGVAGILRVLQQLEIISTELPRPAPCFYSRATSWTRASRSGIVHLEAQLGEQVIAKQQLATIYDPFGKKLSTLRAKHSGMVIGHSQAPLVNRGDAVSHLARLSDVASVSTDPSG